MGSSLVGKVAPRPHVGALAEQPADSARDRDRTAEGSIDAKEKDVSQFDQGIERAGDAVDEKTGGKFAGQVDQAQQQADERVGDNSQ